MPLDGFRTPVLLVSELDRRLLLWYNQQLRKPAVRADFVIIAEY
jgi:hypothetical protein